MSVLSPKANLRVESDYTGGAVTRKTRVKSTGFFPSPSQEGKGPDKRVDICFLHQGGRVCRVLHVGLEKTEHVRLTPSPKTTVGLF